MSYTRAEISHRQYLRKRENGWCMKCGGDVDRQGLYCKKCIRLVNLRHAERRNTLREMGICPYCGKNKLENGQKKCNTCREKSRIYIEKYKKNKN